METTIERQDWDQLQSVFTNIQLCCKTADIDIIFHFPIKWIQQNYIDYFSSNWSKDTMFFE